MPLTWFGYMILRLKGEVFTKQKNITYQLENCSKETVDSIETDSEKRYGGKHECNAPFYACLLRNGYGTNFGTSARLRRIWTRKQKKLSRDE
jgi:hypothetical protein